MIKRSVTAKRTTAMRLLVPSLLAIGALGCGDGESGAGKSFALKTAPLETSEEQARINSLQHVILVTESGSTIDTGVLINDTNSTAPDTLTKLITKTCEAALVDEVSEDASCQTQKYRAYKQACIGRYFLAGTSEDPGEVSFEIVAPGTTHTVTYRYGVQSIETSVALARAGVGMYTKAAGTLWSILNASDTSTTTACDLAELGSTGVAKTVADLVSILKSGEEALVTLHRLTLAAADKQLASTTATDEGTRRSYTALDLSRAAAARLLTSRQFRGEALEVSDLQAYCKVSELSPQARTALDLFRQVGILPVDVVDEAISTASLVEYPHATAGSGTAPGGGSLRQRLVWQLLMSATNSKSVAEEYSLTLAAFEEARSYLRQELRTFDRLSRPPTLPLPPGEYDPSHARSVVTANPPPDRSFAFYQALIDSHLYDDYASDGWPRFDYDWGDVNSNELNCPGILCIKVPDYEHLGGYPELWASEFPSLASYRASVQIMGRRLLARFTDSAVPDRPGYENPDVLGSLGLISQDPELEGVLSICNEQPEERMDFVLFGGEHFKEARVLNYVTDLECATNGTVEGQPCTFDASTGAVLNSLTSSTDTRVAAYQGRASALGYGESDLIGSLDASHYGYPEHIRTRMYLVVPKYPQDPSRRGPGDWRAVAGFAGYLPPDSCYAGGMPCSPPLRCRDIPLIPSLGEKVKDAIAPNPANCGAPKTSCTGVDFDARIPLENELSEDNDGIESSWKYYLNMAEQAAREADQLGQDYLAASLAVDQFKYTNETWRMNQEEKAVAAMDRVQSICGTAIEPESLLVALDDSEHNYNRTTLRSVVNSTAGCSDLEAGETCISQKRVKNLNKVIANRPQLAKLKECLGVTQDSEASTYETVHLGEGSLCAWQIGGKLCAGAGNDPGEIPISCPFYSQTCTVPPDVTNSPAGAGALPVEITEGLSLFDAHAISGPPGNAEACTAIRRLVLHRKDGNGGYTNDLDILRRWKGLSKEQLRSVANALSYELKPNDHIVVKFDGKKWISTEDNDSWPCGTEASYGAGCDEISELNSASHHSSLFCGWHDCTDPEARSKIVNEFSLQIDKLKATTWEDADAQKPTGTRRAYMKGIAPERFATNDALGWKNCNRWQGSIYTCKDNGNLVFVRESASADNPAMLTFPAPWNFLETYDYNNQLDADFSSGEHGLVAYQVTPGFGPGGTSLNYAHQKYNLLTNSAKSVFAAVWAGFDDSFKTSEPGALAKHYINNAQTGLGELLKSTKIYEQIDTDARTSVSPELSSWSVPIPHAGFVTSGNKEMLMAELVCEAEIRSNFVGGNCSERELSDIKSLADAETAGRVLECLGDSILRRAAMATFTEVPKSIADPLREQAGANVFATSGGELAEQYGQLRMALAQVAVAGPAVGHAIKAVGSDVRQLELSGERYNLKDKMAEVQFEATRAQQMANCVEATLSAAASFIGSPKEVVVGVINSVKAATTCVNAYAQVDFASEMRDLGRDLNRVEYELEISDFQRKFDDHIYQFQTLALELQGNLEAFGSSLEHVETLRLEAQKKISEAVWYLSNPASASTVSRAVQARSDLSRIRYERATTAAKRLAFLAKRAIETRLGTPLREMRQTLPLVAAPSTWESTICASNGIDLTRISQSGSKNLRNLVDGSVLTYVQKLGNVVESYRLTNGFHEGVDTAVVSLRDDIHNVRIACNTPSANLLKSPGEISPGTPGGPVGTWSMEGCNGALPNCVAVKPGSAATLLAAGADVERTPVEHTLLFGTADLASTANPSPVPPGCKPGTEANCGWQTGARLIQRVDLQPGVYRFSWYGTQTVSNDVSTTSIPMGGLSTVAPVSVSGPGIVIGPDGAPVSTDRAWYDDIDGGIYQRRAVVFTVPEAGQYQVGFAALSSADGQYQYKIAGPMLERERLNPAVLGDSPGAYEDGGSDGLAYRTVCEDSEGSKFRTTKWRRNCEYVCPNGYKSDCTEALVERCFWETGFYIAQRNIERADMMTLSGFARGNYNYRIEEVGLNFVGTGTRDCSASTTPATCYGAGFIPYSLEQRGPFFVKNEKGIDYQFDLFPGRIEHARGLATERYLTNPISSPDQQLLTSYMRPELRGRPLDGNFTIRIWDEPGVTFNTIEDVQLVLKYRYWTLGQ